MRSTWMAAELFPVCQEMIDSAPRWRSRNALTSALLPPAAGYRADQFGTASKGSPILHRRAAEFLRVAANYPAKLVVMADIWVVVGILGFVAAMVSLIFGVGRV